MTQLVCLAAGSSTRFGRPKQLEPLLADGATLLDFTIADALRSGVRRVALVIREQLRSEFEGGIQARWKPRVSIDLVAQPPQDAGRLPWGTVAALVAAGPLIDSPFVVANADDYYGRDALAAMILAVGRLPADVKRGALAGYPVGETLSRSGGVHRAFLSVRDSTLTGIEELRDLVASDDRTSVVVPADPARALPRDAMVSLNLWGFTPAVLPAMASSLERFRIDAAPSDELRIADAVASMLANSAIAVDVIAVHGPWAGLTHPGDRQVAAALLQALTDRGDYQSPVWS